MKEDKNTEQKDTLLKDLSAELKKAREDIEVLKNVADKKQLSLYYQRNQNKLPTELNLRMIDGKIILRWSMIKDEVYQDMSTKRWIEDQRVKVYFEDETTVVMNLVDFNRKYILVKCTRVGIIKNDITGIEQFKVVRQDNSKEYIVSYQFVN